MANKKYLVILKQGVEVWNRWREENPEISPDLSRADLRGATLSGTNLREADLREADLSGTDLREADLRKTDLRGADLSRADLSEAYLREADLSRADLRGADLSRADLSRADLRGADLSEADLSLAYLREADLSRADLSRADLRGANLRGTNLREADLRETDLSGTDLREADLRETDLRGADLSRADLSRAEFIQVKLGWTSFGNVDLSQVEGLDTVNHNGPSYLDIQTIYHSGGNIPEVFLRGVGVPDNIITYIASLTAQAFEFYSCFISYASPDDAFVRRLYADLQNEGIRCWFAPEDMKIGDEIRPVIDQAIRIHDKLLLVLSEYSINSTWVKKEVETAFDEEYRQGRQILFPVCLDNAVLETEQAWAADIRRQRHIGDLTHWKDHDSYRAGFERLLKDLRSESNKGG